MTIKKVCFQFAQSSEENMKYQPAEWSDESAEFDTLEEHNPQDDFCATSPRKSPTSILLAPKRASLPTLRQDSRRRVSFFVPPSIPPPLFDEIQHRNLPGSPRTTERRRALAELAIFECGRMESNCMAPPDQPLTIPVRRFSNDDFVLY